MKKILFFFLLLCIAASCKKPEVKIPDGVLKKDQMVPILADVHIAQAVAVMNAASDTTRYSMSDLMNYIFKIHYITKAQYDSSISFYTKHPEMMSQIYDSVITELSKKQGEAEGATIIKPTDINKPTDYGR
jgi:hypothetical protein